MNGRAYVFVRVSAVRMCTVPVRGLGVNGRACSFVRASAVRMCTVSVRGLGTNGRACSFVRASAVRMCAVPVPPNLALISACTYGAVGRALGSLVKLVPRLLLHLQTVPFITRQVTVCTNQGKDQRSHALPQYIYCITTNTTQSAAVRRYYRERRHS